MIKPRKTESPRLPFPTKTVRACWATVEEYIIPEESKAKVLEQLCPFRPVPALDEKQYDVHERKTFVVRDFRVIRENGANWLMSPYYAKSGGSVIDWMPE